MNLSVFEAVMLICFGLAWPLSIIKSIKSRSTKGKSLFFMIVIGIGYVSGIAHKILYSTDLVMILYILNLLFVITDLILFYVNRKREKAG